MRNVLFSQVEVGIGQPRVVMWNKKMLAVLKRSLSGNYREASSNKKEGLEASKALALVF